MLLPSPKGLCMVGITPARLADLNLRILLGIATVPWMATLLTLPPAQAGSLSGSASYRETFDLPLDAVFEAVLIDAAIADGPARELGRVRLRPAGQPPFRFTIPYRDGDVRPGGRYAVRATVRQGTRLLFTTDTFTPVLTGGASQPLTLLLVRVGGEPQAAGQSPLGPLPASWRGDLPGAGGLIRWQVDLAGDGSYQLRQTFVNRPAPNRFDAIGRWRLEPGRQRLVLGAAGDGPLWFQPLDGGAVLKKLDQRGQPIASLHHDQLRRLAAPEPIDPRLHLLGRFRYMADAASIQLCATGRRLPVAMEGDYRRLEQAYLQAHPGGAGGQPRLVALKGLISDRPSAEPGRQAERTLVVERFIALYPGKDCPPARPSRKEAIHGVNPWSQSMSE
jgi:uncharacterized lipoprotein YbaY/uncharacterized lipoprotein NlpE involved in copper resistance